MHAMSSNHGSGEDYVLNFKSESHFSNLDYHLGQAQGMRSWPWFASFGLPQGFVFPLLGFLRLFNPRMQS